MKHLLSIPLFGSIVNALTIIVCAFVGYVLRRRIREDVMELPKQCLGLFSVVLGVGMALKTQNMLVVVFSLCVGGIIGGLLDIDGRIERMIERVQSRHKELGSSFSQGFVTAMLIFCIGSMAVLGAFEEGLGGYPALLLTKSLMDGLMSIALSASFGIGVVFSAIPVFLYQGGLTLAARVIQPYMTEAATIEMTATGGVMLLGVGLSILGLVRVKLMNALPGLVIAVVLVRLFVE